jgi:cobalt-zinc-cadmium efflux system outer membrane protein
VQLAADAQLARVTLDIARAQRESDAAYRRLALLWGERDATPQPLAVDEPALPAVPDFAQIAALLENTPEIARFADEQRVREARLQLARSERSADLDWQVGVRRLQRDGDWALAGSVSLPLGAAARAQPGIRAAEAELAALDVERESGELALYATLAQVHGRLDASVAEAGQLRDELLPRLLKAENAAEQAYRAGALSYLEWAQLQADTTAARRQQLGATIEAQRLLIELQRLTATSFADAAIAAPAAKDARP